MNCPKCGYAMSELDAECPRCKRMGQAKAAPGGTPSVASQSHGGRRSELQSVEIYEVEYGSYLKMASLQLAIIYLPTLWLSQQVQGGRDLTFTVGFLAGGYLYGLLTAVLVVWALNTAAERAGGIRISLRVRQPVASGLHELRFIGLLSALRVGLMAGLFIGFMVFFLSGPMEGLLGEVPSSSEAQTLLGLVLGCTIGGAVGGTVSALLYNGLAALVGGVRFRMG